MQNGVGHASADTSTDTLDRLTMAEAAKRLGVTKDAVRKRVQRGNIPYEKDKDGVVFVYLDRGDAGPRTGGQTSTDTSRDEAMEILRDQVTFLQRELERKDALLLNMTEVMKAISPPQDSSPETRDSDLTASEEPGGTRRGHPVSQEPETQEERRSWLYRFFFGP
jgi:excisionase family DNA binding protein